MLNGWCVLGSMGVTGMCKGSVDLGMRKAGTVRLSFVDNDDDNDDSCVCGGTIKG
jgi:hypothetical protein